MTNKEKIIHDAIYKLITPDKPAIVVPRKVDCDETFLKQLMSEAKRNTKAELNNLVKKKQFKKKEADEIFNALVAVSKIVRKPFCLVAVFPELKDGDLYLHSVATELDVTQV